MEILTGEQMRNVDRRAIDGMGIPGLQLMEAAGAGVARALLADRLRPRGGHVVVLCGKGNNGGDGMVVARHLRAEGIDARVVLLGSADRLSGDAAVQHGSALSRGIEVRETTTESDWSRECERLAQVSLVVDAILGTGVRGGARGLVARVIEDLNACEAVVVSVDLPSGLDADSGEVAGVAVRASHTYTLCRPKLPLVVEPAAGYCGTWSVIPIGIPDAAVEGEGADLSWLDATAAARLWNRRPDDSHKGTYGHLLGVAGSRGKSGAAVLLARAALRAGVGLMTVASPASVQPWIACQQAELMTEPLAETRSGALSRQAAAGAIDLLSGCDALAIGPGLGTAPSTRSAVRSILRRRRAPAVLDADGLNAFATGASGKTPKLSAGRQPLVLTPHPGEAGRLLGWSSQRVQADRRGAARKLVRRSGAVVVLKGHRTLVAEPDGPVAVSSSGNPGMASAGVGDVLTGVVGAFLARGMEAGAAARLAVFAHGDAGDRAARERGQDGLIASDVTDRIPAALHALAGARRKGS